MKNKRTIIRNHIIKLYAFGIIFIATFCTSRKNSESSKSLDQEDSTVYNVNIDHNKDSINIKNNIAEIQNLITAVRNNNYELVHLILEKGVDANSRIHYARNYWNSPLSEAVINNNLELVKELLNYGADPNLDLGENLTAFHRSFTNYKTNTQYPDEFYQILFKYGGNVNTFNSYHYKTPLYVAIQNKNIDRIKFLIKNGAIINSDSINGFIPPLSVAAGMLDSDLLKLLIENGADINETFTEGYGDCIICPDNITVLHSIISALPYSKKEKVYEVIDYLFTQSPDLNIESEYGQTALDFAAFIGDTILVDKLIIHGALIESKNRSALNLVIEYSKHNMLRHLLKYNPNVNHESFPFSSLIQSFECCGDGFGEGISEAARVETIKLLLDNGADLKPVNYHGKTFIELVKKNYHPEVTELLIKRGLISKVEIEN